MRARDDSCRPGRSLGEHGSPAGRSFISAEDLVLAVPEAWGVNGTGQVIGLGTAVVVSIYNQGGDLLTMQCERC